MLQTDTLQFTQIAQTIDKLVFHLVKARVCSVSNDENLISKLWGAKNNNFFYLTDREKCAEFTREKKFYDQKFIIKLIHE